jgi:hypothetical protein
MEELVSTKWAAVIEARTVVPPHSQLRPASRPAVLYHLEKCMRSATQRNTRTEAQGHRSRREMFSPSVGSEPPYFTQIDKGTQDL